LSSLKWVRKISHLNPSSISNSTIQTKILNIIKLKIFKNPKILINLKKIITLKISLKTNTQTINQTKQNKSKSNNNHQRLPILKIKTLKNPRQLINNLK